MSDLSIPDLIVEAEPVNVSTQSRMVKTLRSIVNQYADNYEYFVKSLPTAILMQGQLYVRICLGGTQISLMLMA